MAPQEADFTIDENGNITFGKESPKEFEPIPSGEYDFVVQDVKQKVGKESGKPYFAFELRSSVPDDEKLDNKPVWENISPTAKWRMTELYEAVFGKQEVEDGTELTMNMFDLFGAKVRARVRVEPNNEGRMVNSISRFIQRVD